MSTPQIPSTDDLTRLSLGSSQPKRIHDWWLRHHIPISPRQLVAAFCAGLPGKINCDISYDTEERFKLSQDLTLENWHGLTARWEISPARHSARLDWIMVASHLRGSGLGRQAIASAVDTLANKLDIRQIELEAGLSVGPWIWARCGFLPTDDSQWRGLRGGILKALDALNEPLPETIDHLARTALCSDDRQSLWLIADLDHKLADGDKLGLYLCRAGVDNWYGAWPAILKLDDAAQMTRFRAYVGKAPDATGLTRELARRHQARHGAGQ